MFIPGETISHQFFIPFVRSDVGKILVTYRQFDDVILVKTVYPGQIETLEGKSQFTVTLSQEESLLFDNEADYYIQLNVIFTSGARCASSEMRGTNGVQHVKKVVTANV